LANQSRRKEKEFGQRKEKVGLFYLHQASLLCGNIL
jgi:hypothetical protein